MKEPIFNSVHDLHKTTVIDTGCHRLHGIQFLGVLHVYKRCITHVWYTCTTPNVLLILHIMCRIYNHIHIICITQSYIRNMCTGYTPKYYFVKHVNYRFFTRYAWINSVEIICVIHHIHHTCIIHIIHIHAWPIMLYI